MTKTGYKLARITTVFNNIASEKERLLQLINKISTIIYLVSLQTIFPHSISSSILTEKGYFIFKLYYFFISSLWLI